MRKYTVPGDEGYEPGSQNTVLKNYYRITSKSEMDILETKKLSMVQKELQSKFDSDHQFTIRDLCWIHEQWLGEIYPFAGQYRTVNMSKDGYTFASSSRLEALMVGFEKNYIKKIHTLP